MRLDRVSIEVSNRCSKGCGFCYNGSGPGGGSSWSEEALVGFVSDCARNGVRSVSFGGGEPLEWPPLLAVLGRLRGALARSLTTSGLPLDGAMIEGLAACAPEKVHVSIHAPGSAAEVERVLGAVRALERRGIRSGVNLLVARSQLGAAERAAARLRGAGVGNDRVVYLPMRGRDTPSPEEMARVAGRAPFQSTSCLARCGKSPRFASVGWDRRVAWCSYTSSRRAMVEPTFASLLDALSDLDLTFCGDPHDALLSLGRGRSAAP